MAEYVFSIGGNVSDVVYFGAAFNIVSVDYEKTLISSQTKSDGPSNFDKLDYTRYIAMGGYGYNFKFGIITTPFVNSDMLTGLRIGAAIHSPTILDMKDVSHEGLSVRRNSRDYPSVSTNDNRFEYSIETSAKYLLGVAYVFTGDGTWRGIVSADYEYIDYSKVKLRENSGYVFSGLQEENDRIAASYKNVSNVRIGGELGYKKLSLRAGYARYANPYSYNVDNQDITMQILSLGLGIKATGQTTIDFTYTRGLQRDKDKLFNESVDYSITQNNFLMTVGWRF
jgi:hypothetical protein